MSPNKRKNPQKSGQAQPVEPVVDKKIEEPPVSDHVVVDTPFIKEGDAQPNPENTSGDDKLPDGLNELEQPVQPTDTGIPQTGEEALNDYEDAKVTEPAQPITEVPVLVPDHDAPEPTGPTTPADIQEPTPERATKKPDKTKKKSWLPWALLGILGIVAILAAIWQFDRSRPAAVVPMAISQTATNPIVIPTVQQRTATPETPAETAVVVEVVPVAPTTEPVGNTCLAAFDASAMTPFHVQENMDVGDPALWSIVGATNDLGQIFVAVIEPGYNLDFEATTITGSFAQSAVDKQTAVCAAAELGGNINASYQLYIGATDAPEGWEITYPIGWRMTTTMYTETTIVVEGAVWNTTTIAIDDENHEYGDPTGWTYVQLWNGTDPTVVYHLVVEPGYMVSSTALQGTMWTISGEFDESQLVTRFAQMSAEVDQRDDHPMIIMIYVGANTPPTGWSNDLPTGWTAAVR